MPGLTRYRARVCLLLASSCLALLLAEGGLRVFAPHTRDHVLPGRLFEIDEHLGWKLKANRQVTHHSRYFDVSYTTNASGFRDRAREGSTASGGYRVLLHGDSQIFGWGVSEDDRFSNLLERSMPSLELWNLAVPGYGLDQQMLSYGRTSAVDANEVLFFVSGTTLDRCHYDTMYGKPKPMFVKDQTGVLRSVPPRPVGTTRWLYEVLSPLYLPQFVNRHVEILRVNLEEAREKRSQEARGGTAASESRIGDFEKELLILARDMAAERGQKMSILAASRSTRADLRDFCDRHGIRFLAVDFDRLRPNHMFGKEDLHWTPRAHQLLAEQIAAQVDWEVAGAQ